MVNAGMGPTHVTTFLAGCNIPPVDESTLRKREKTLDPVLIQSAEASCCEAQKEEQEHQGDFLEGSFDAGWQKRGSGWQYNSNTGREFLEWVSAYRLIKKIKMSIIFLAHLSRRRLKWATSIVIAHSPSIVRLSSVNFHIFVFSSKTAFQRNVTGSKISTSFTKFVFFGQIGKTTWRSWPLIG